MSDLSPSHKKNGLSKWLLGIGFVAITTFTYVSYAASEDEKTATAADTPPAPVAEIITVEPQTVRIWTDFSGRLSAVDTAEIKAQVSGELQKVLFTDGQTVNKGDLLFVIDPRPYKAAVNSAEAKLASAKSKATLAKDELARAESLVKGKLVSESVFDAAKNTNQVALADIREAESALSQAKLDLDYCYIRAPFSGQLSRAELTVGNIIEMTPSSPVLTTIVSNDRVYAEFDIDETNYIKIKHSLNKQAKMPVEMTLAADAGTVYKGDVYSLDNKLDIASGTIRARAIFDNTDGILTPGMYANVRVGSIDKQSVLLIPNRAIGTNQSQKFVMVVNPENIATYRPVEIGGYHQDQRIITSGLENGDRVIVNGLSHIRPNSPVNPKPIAQAKDSTE
ncbi:MAG TPA: efflux RND transporter periplasmic adaptor subunit [Methylophaga aminisulfidivorans]|uniref:Efflux RND transporter periplasmic adaptor subunit n=1 Tax=Methylophaga aminisulfidivorans TaxID=230105 RepID=A0A7C1VT51_9GAMM|nr:efflux RND transporter periplasmic adaptor subunit [Methylophaga aminisulfidivorans]